MVEFTAYITSLVENKNASPCIFFPLVVKRIFEISVNKKIKSRYRFIFFTRAKFLCNFFTKNQIYLGYVREKKR